MYCLVILLKWMWTPGPVIGLVPTTAPVPPLIIGSSSQGAFLLAVGVVELPFTKWLAVPVIPLEQLMQH
jgi:hypothetical protein